MPNVHHNTDLHRFEIRNDDGSLAGFAVYHLRANRILLVHTEVDPAFEGQGLGGQLARAALDDARERGLKLVPLCTFIAGWIDKHPQYTDLVDHEMLAALER